MRTGWKWTALMIYLAVPAAIRADDTGLAEGGAAYLDFSFGSRALAMGRAQTAVPPEDSAVLHANAALPALLPAHSLSATSGLLGLDRSLYFAAYTAPIRMRRSDEDFDTLEDPDFQLPGRPAEHHLNRPASSAKFPRPFDNKSEFSSSPRKALEALDESEQAAPDRSMAAVDDEGHWNRIFVTPKHIDMALAVGMVYFGVESIEGRSEFGAPEASFQDSERAIYASYAARMFRNFAFGLSGKYLGQTLQSAHATGFAFDVGTWYGVPHISRGRLDLGLAIRDIAGSLKWTVSDPFFASDFSYREPVLMKMAGGLAYTSPAGNWLLALDVLKAKNQKVRAHTGVEWRKLEHWKLRAGLDAYNPAVGFGFDWGVGKTRFKLDYAFQYDLNALVNPHWLTLSMQFLPRR